MVTLFFRLALDIAMTVLEFIIRLSKRLFVIRRECGQTLARVRVSRT